MSFQEDRDGRRRRKPDPESESSVVPAPRTRPRRGSDDEVGNALRSAYERMVNEDIPPEMLDLLGKLG